MLSSEISSTERGIFKSRDGTPLYYESRGSGQPLIFCYGLTCRIEHWRYQLSFFEKDYRVIALDYRGHHRSGSPRNGRNMTIKWCARDVEDLMNHLKLSRAVCLGHSFGAPVCVYLANFCQEKVAGLVLICGSVVRPFEHMFHSNKLDAIFKLSSKLYGIAPGLVGRGWYEFTKQNWFSYFMTARFGWNPEKSNEQDISAYMQGVHESPVETFHNLLKDYNEFDGRKLLPHVKAPALIVAGGEDWITPFYLQEEMAGLIPGATLHKVEKGSHNAHMDYPEEVNREIARFLREKVQWKK
ncbi:MAG: alpha/beta hydrolase [Bdellovibrionaceae bacterium]|nr:alpha/beta hydrolase [Pseudobdellovibrionaceae bacterium]